MDHTVSEIFTIISVIIAVVTVIVIVFKYLKRSLFGVSCKNAMDPGKRILLYSGLLLVSIFCIRFAVGYYTVSLGQNELNSLEEIFNSMIHALQTFSMDEDYTQYIRDGKAMANAVFGPDYVGIYGFYFSVLNLLAPIAGGAIVYQIISNVYPDIRLKFSFIRPCYYFSELNERSITLAESLVEHNHAVLGNPLVIFASTDDSKEDVEEFVPRAKLLGAICTKSDISEITSFSFRRKNYFLIDENTMDNIRALAALSNDSNFTHLKKAKVYIFCQNDSFVLTEHNIITNLEKLFKNKYKRSFKRCINSAENKFSRDKAEKELKEKYNTEKTELSQKELKQRCKTILSEIDKLSETEQKNLKAEYDKAADIFLNKKMPEIIRVRHYSTMILDLLNDVPLFSPVIDINTKENADKDLNVTILGLGVIGMEMLLNTYWCGQMYGYNLCLNVATLDKNNPNDIINRIDKAAPEFFVTALDEHEVLEVYPKGSSKQQHNDKYLTFRYAYTDLTNCDVDEIVLKEHNGQSEHQLLDSDYYVIALGSDEMNITVAERIARNIAVKRVGKDKEREVVIAFAVYDPDLCELLNKENKYSDSKIRMHAFGNLRELYSWNNITKLRRRPYIKEYENEYEDITYKDPNEMIENNRLVYNYWSSTARDMHTKYRVFSAFNFLRDNNQLGDWESFKAFDVEMYKKYNKLVIDENSSKESDEYKELAGSALVKYLRWLEHRRWNAYMRSIGFRSGDIDELKDIDKDTRVALRLHPCIVECKDELYNAETPDRLDIVTKTEKKEDYKIYDFPKRVDLREKSEKHIQKKEKIKKQHSK